MLQITKRPLLHCAMTLLLSASADCFALDVAGTVRDSTGSGLAHVRICILPDGKTCARSDSAGRFHVASPPVAIRPLATRRPVPQAGPIGYYRWDGRFLGLLQPGRPQDLPPGYLVLHQGTEPRALAKAAARNESLDFSKPGYLSVTYVPKAPAETGVEIRMDAHGDSIAFLLDGGIGSAHLAWDPVPDAERYLIRYSREGFPDSDAGEIEVVSPAVVEGLRPGDTYRFQLAAVRADGNAAWSAIQTLRMVLSAGFMGDPGFTPGPVSVYSAAIDAEDRVWVAFVDSTRSDRITVMRSAPQGWETVGAPGFSPTLRKAPNFSAYPVTVGLSVFGAGDPVLWYREGGTDTLWFWVYEGSAWKPLGAPVSARSAAARTAEAVYVQTYEGNLRELTETGWSPIPSPANCPITGLTFGEALIPYATCAVNKDPWDTKVVRRDDTGWTTLSRNFPTYDRDITVPATLHLAGRDEAPYLIIHRINGGKPVYRLREEGEEALDQVTGTNFLFTRDALPLAFGTFDGILQYCEPPGNTWKPVPLDGENPAPKQGSIALLDSKDRLYQVYRDPAREFRLTVSVLAP